MLDKDFLYENNRHTNSKKIIINKKYKAQMIWNTLSSLFVGLLFTAIVGGVLFSAIVGVIYKDGKFYMIDNRTAHLANGDTVVAIEPEKDLLSIPKVVFFVDDYKISEIISLPQSIVTINQKKILLNQGEYLAVCSSIDCKERADLPKQFLRENQILGKFTELTLENLKNRFYTGNVKLDFDE